MRHRDRLGGLEIVLWSGLGIGVGLVTGFVLSEWVGDVNRRRVSGVARLDEHVSARDRAH